MIAPSKIRCRVIAVPVSGGLDSQRSLSPRPSELVPWADPYIAALVNKLQSEVRHQRAEQRDWEAESAGLPLTAFELGGFEVDEECFDGGCFDDAEWPWNEEYEYEPGDGESWSDLDDRPGELPAMN